MNDRDHCEKCGEDVFHKMNSPECFMLQEWKKDRAERDALLAEKFVPGNFRCAKCNLVLISKTLYMKSGNIGANYSPADCSNGCGPMWRVSWEERAKDLEKRFEALYAEKESWGNEFSAVVMAKTERDSLSKLTP